MVFIVLELCLQIGLCYNHGNFVKFFRLVESLPIMFKLAVSKFCQKMMSRAVSVCQVAYKSPNLKYPLVHLSKLLWIQTDDLQGLLQSWGFKVENNHVWFGIVNKDQFDSRDENIINCYQTQMTNHLIKIFDRVDDLIFGVLL